VKIRGRDYRSVWMDGRGVRLIDQRLLPWKLRVLTLRTVPEVADAIRNMAVRGAPAIGATGCYGMALADKTGVNKDRAYATLLNTRPTAYDLKDGLDYYLAASGAPKHKADAYADASAERCRMIGVHGARLIRDGMNVLTHCNAGAIACVDWGTALAPLRVAKMEGRTAHVWVDETRPRLQGAKLTAWELMEEDIPCTLIADNAAGHLMKEGRVDLVLVGADRIAANGDFANKIGTYEKAVLARENDIPFYVAAPSTTIDRKCASGRQIPIEERGQDEVTRVTGRSAGQDIAPRGCKAYNPAFDVTPAKYVTAYLTEKGVLKPGRF